jgi:hypothetical protein
MLHPWIGAIRNGASIVQGLGAGIGKPHYRIPAEPQINRRPIQPETLGPGLRNPPWTDGFTKNANPLPPLLLSSHYHLRSHCFIRMAVNVNGS